MRTFRTQTAWIWFTLILLGMAFVVVYLYPEPRAASSKSESVSKPRLAVLIVIDQMRADYLTKWRHLFVKDGFNRLIDQGAWFKDCRYPYANTMTAAGHASMATGCAPDKHGVIANSWYDRRMSQVINAVQTPRYPLVPLLGKEKRGAAPTRLKQKTIGDALLEQTKMKGKVVSISIKDRAAILLSALLRALVLWFDRASGYWVTSTYYNDALPRWVLKYNKSRQPDRWFGRNWKRLRRDLDYGLLSGPDDFPFEGTGYEQGHTFPHPTTGGLKKVGEEYYSALVNSPFANDMTFQMAKLAVQHERLGQDDVPDLLCISLSCNDYIGHCWGPDSQEVLDVTLRSDLLIRDFLRFLDRKVGKGKYSVVLCADHGVCPLPEVRRASGFKDAGRVDPSTLAARAQAFLTKRFAKELNWIESVSSGMVYLNRNLLNKRGVNQGQVEQALAKWLKTQPGVRTAFTRTQLTGKIPGAKNKLLRQVARSFHPECSGDVLPVIEPYHLLVPFPKDGKGAYTTTHGSPHNYDTHVPLVVFGPKIRAGQYNNRVTPLTVAPILARCLGINPPPGTEVSIPKKLLR